MSKNYILQFVLFALLSGLSASSYAQKKLLNGQIISKKDSSYLVAVHVLNTSTNQATNSASDGFFTMPYTPGDTIVLTSIGYNDHYLYTGTFWIPSGQMISIYMTERVYSLPGFDVNQYSSKQAFKEDFTNQQPAKPIINELFQYDEPSELEDVPTDLNAHIPLGSPITKLYNKFGREARTAKKLAKSKAELERQKTIEERYNPGVVQRVLELDSKLEAEKFMEGCPLEDEFVLKAKEYDIVKAILDCQNNTNPTSK